MSKVSMGTISGGSPGETSSEEHFVYNLRKSGRVSYKLRPYSLAMTVQPKKGRFFGDNRDEIASAKRRKRKPKVKVLYINENFGTDSDSDVGKHSKTLLSWDKSFFREKELALEIRRSGLTLKKVEEGSTSFFRAIADQIYGDRNYHAVVREQCMDYIEANQAYYASFLSAEFQLYVKQMRMTTAYPSSVEMQAIAELYQRSLAVYTYNCEFTFLDPQSPMIAVNYYSSIIRYNQVPIELCCKSKIRSTPSIRVLYHNDQRYTSLRKSVYQKKVSRRIPKKEIEKVPKTNVIIYKLWWTVPITTIQLSIGKKKVKVIRHIRRGLRCPRLRRKVSLPKKQKIINKRPHYVYPRPDSTSSWMTVGIQAHRRLLADTMSDRKPYFCFAPYYMIPRKISLATITSHSITAWSCIVSHQVSTANDKRLQKRKIEERSVTSFEDLEKPSTSKSKADLREHTHAKNTSNKYDIHSTRTLEDLDKPSTSKSKTVMDLKEYNTSDEYNTCSTSTLEDIDSTGETSNKYSSTTDYD